MIESRDFEIRPATADDVPALFRMIVALVDHEGLSSELMATEASLHESLFGPSPAAEAVLGCVGREPVAYAVFYRIFPTALGRPSLYLEDLYVEPGWRGQGFGRSLLVHVAALALSRGCARLEWHVQDRNAKAIRFYRSLGAEPEHAIASTAYRLGAADLQRLAARAPR